MNYIQINTSQNVNIDFALAGIANRILSFIIDWIIKGAYLIFLFYVIFDKLRFGEYLDGLDMSGMMAVMAIVTSPVLFYSLVFESLMEGQTPGKRLMKIKVIKIDGYQARFSDYLIRWFFALVDIYISSACVGLISIIMSKKEQRLGGMASGTAVISLAQKITIDHTILTEVKSTYTPVYPTVILLNDIDMQIIKTHLLQALKEKNYHILDKLAQKIQETAQIKEVKTDNRTFIETVIKDYNYLTGKEVA